MNGQVTLYLLIPERGWPPCAKTKATQFAWSSCLFSLLLAVSFHLCHSRTRAGKGAGVLLSDHLKVCLSTSLLWNCSPNPWQDGILIPFFPSFSFLINSLELPGAAGCRRANRSHFRPVLALKGAGCDECVLGVHSHPSPAMCGWRDRGHLSQNLLGLCHPVHPNSHLQCWLWMPGWHEEREGREVRGGGGGGGGS